MMHSEAERRTWEVTYIRTCMRTCVHARIRAYTTQVTEQQDVIRLQRGFCELRVLQAARRLATGSADAQVRGIGSSYERHMRGYRGAGVDVDCHQGWAYRCRAQVRLRVGYDQRKPPQALRLRCVHACMHAYDGQEAASQMEGHLREQMKRYEALLQQKQRTHDEQVHTCICLYLPPS